MPPIQRDPDLQAVSRDHHQALLVCWKIRTGLAKSVSAERIKAFCDFFYKNHLLPHFELEEKYIFPLLGKDDGLVQKALEEHIFLKTLFEKKEDLKGTLQQIETLMEAHVRFEERILFNEIQKLATRAQLQQVHAIHDGQDTGNYPIDSWEDKFWGASK